MKKIIQKLKKKEVIFPIEQTILDLIMGIERYLYKTNYSLLANSCLFSDKLFLGADGNYYICEKMGNNMPIGNVQKGLDFKEMIRIANEFQSLIKRKCWDCEYKFLCNKCYATFAEEGKFFIEEKFCKEARERILGNLKMYVKLKEDLNR